MIVTTTVKLLMGLSLFVVFYRTGEGGRMPTMGILALLLMLAGIGFVDVFTEDNLTLICIVFSATLFFSANSFVFKMIGFFGAVGAFAYPILDYSIFGPSTIGLFIGIFVAIIIIYPLSLFGKQNYPQEGGLVDGSNKYFQPTRSASILEKAISTTYVSQTDEP